MYKVVNKSILSRYRGGGGETPDQAGILVVKDYKKESDKHEC